MNKISKEPSIIEKRIKEVTDTVVKDIYDEYAEEGGLRLSPKNVGTAINTSIQYAYVYGFIDALSILHTDDPDVQKLLDQIEELGFHT